jgi:hypothetical protein
MGAASYIQTSFLGGEWSKSMQGRIDRPDYRQALNTSVNGLPMETGAWVRKPGSHFAGTTRSGNPGRVIEFDFKQSAPYSMEFTDGHMRFRNGTSIATTNDAQVVVSISSANPALMTTTTATTWATGDQVFFKNVTSATPLLMNRFFSLTKVSTTTFTLTDAITGANIDGSTLGTIGAISVARALDIVTPYTAGSWALNRSVQADLQTVLLNPAIQPNQLSVVQKPSGAVFASFSLAQAVFQDGPYLDPFTNGVLATPSALTGIVNITLSFAVWSASVAYPIGSYVTYSSVNYICLTAQNVNLQPDTHSSNWAVVNSSSAVAPGGFQASDVGRLLRFFSEPALWVVGGSYTAGNVVAIASGVNGGFAYYTCLTNHTATLLNAPGVSVSTWAVNSQGAIWTWGQITALINLISGTLAGSTNIGTLSSLANAFNGTTNQTFANSAVEVTTNANPEGTYGGKNYSGASAQAITSVTVFPSSDRGLIYPAYINNASRPLYSPGTFALRLRAKQTLPANRSDGTLLGSSFGSLVVQPGNASYTALLNPVTIISNDQVTTWNYVWVDMEYDYVVPGDAVTLEAQFGIAQIQFIAPVTASSSNGVSVQILGNPLLYTSPVRTWRLGVYSNTTGWPANGTYHEGRLWLGGVVDNRFDAGQPGPNLFNFAPTQVDGTVTAANAITYLLDGPDVNPIYWMQPDQQGVIMGTQAGEWLVEQAATTSGLSPLNIRARRVTRIGCANIEPRRTEHTNVFVHKANQKVMEYFPDVYSGKFSAPNLSLTAKHLTARLVQELAYQQEHAPIVWARCLDGSLIGCTYKRDTLMTMQGPTFAGWHQHTHGGGRLVESICAGSSPNGNQDTLITVTNDNIANVRHVEVMADIFLETDSLTGAWQLDDAIAPTYYQSIVIGGINSLKLYGLYPLAGKTVTVFAGGLDCGDWLVAADGTIAVALQGATLPNPLLTSAFISSFSGAMPIVVGFTFTSKGQVLRPLQAAESGTRLGPSLGDTRRTNKLAVLLNNTQGISFGTSFTDSIGGTTSMKALRLVTGGGNGAATLAANSLFSGVAWVPLTDPYSYDSMLCWQITRPFPASITAIGGTVHTEDQ